MRAIKAVKQTYRPSAEVLALLEQFRLMVNDCRGDQEHHRQLWCKKCGRWMDRDLVGVLNISRRGRVRFARSSTEGGAGEAVKGNAERDGEPLILRVDAPKLRHAQQTQ